MKKLHIFTEEPSAKICFEALIANGNVVIKDGEQIKIHAHEGKKALEYALSKTIPTISGYSGSKILVTIDQDKNDCKELKAKIEKILRENCRCDYKIRIVCKELESWFLGDLEAVAKSYPRFNIDQHKNKSKMRRVDEIDQPSKKLLKIIPEYKDKKALPKIEASKKISPHLDLNKNTSPSFKNTILAIKTLLSQ